MSNETTAQRISSLLTDDGQCWTDALGRHLNELAEAEGGRRTFRDGWGTDTYRWHFADGSVILVAGDAWDYPLSTDPRCWCFEVGNYHQEECPLTHLPERGSLSRTAAKRRAHKESHMYRQGAGWIVSTWSDHDGLNVLSEELPFFVARQGLADWRRERTAELLGEEPS